MIAMGLHWVLGCFVQVSGVFQLFREFLSNIFCSDVCESRFSCSRAEKKVCAASILLLMAIQSCPRRCVNP